MWWKLDFQHRCRMQRDITLQQSWRLYWKKKKKHLAIYHALTCHLPDRSDEAACSKKRVSKLGCVSSSAPQKCSKASGPLIDRRSTNRSARNRASDEDSISRSSTELNTPLRTSIGSTRDTSNSFTINDLCFHNNIRATPHSAIFLPLTSVVLRQVLELVNANEFGKLKL